MLELLLNASVKGTPGKEKWNRLLLKCTTVDQQSCLVQTDKVDIKLS